MTQRIFKPLENEQDKKDLFDLLPDWVNWITKDKNSIKIFKDKPYFNKYNIWQTDENENDIIKHRDIDFQSIAYTRSIIQRPINYQDWIGKWGVFADNEEYLKFPIDEAHFGKLLLIEKGKFYCGASATSYPYNFFRPLTQEEKQNIMEN